MDEKEKAPVVVLPDDPVTCILVKAAEIVRKGWIQGWGDRHNTCALGAIGVVTADYPSHWHATPEGIKAATRLAKVVGVPTAYDIPGWNDLGVRKKKDVIDAFEKAIKSKD